MIVATRTYTFRRRYPAGFRAEDPGEMIEDGGYREPRPTRAMRAELEENVERGRQSFEQTVIRK